jgi:hypothetical protein
VAASNVPWLLTYEQQASAYSSYVIGAWLFWMALVALNFLLLPRRARRLFRQRTSFQDAIGYGWSEEGLAVRSSHGSSLIPWTHLHRWVAAQHCFLFFVDEQLFFFIPRSALDEAQAQDLEATAAASGAPRPAAP